MSTSKDKVVKAQYELNFFKNSVEIGTLNGGQKFALFVQLTREGAGGSTSQHLVRVSKETFITTKQAYRAIETGEYSLPEELKSYLITIEDYNRDYSASRPIVYEEHGKYLIAEIGERYNDDEPNDVFVNKYLSNEKWSDLESAESALESGLWTLRNEWELTNYYLQQEPLKVEYNELRNGWVYCRELIFRNEGGKGTEDEFMVDYLEMSPKTYSTKEDAESALTQYLENL